jgi:hypothetical protein
MAWPGLVLALAAGASPPTAAPWPQVEGVADPPAAVSLTLYRDGRMEAAPDPSQGLALVTETRTVEVPAGVSRIRFRGVADTMVPQTAALEGLPGRVVERNEDYDLLTPGALVAHAIGAPVRVIQTSRHQVTERRAVIRSGPDGVLLDFDGKIEALGCGGPSTRLVFDHVPSSLADTPTFSVLADAPRAGRYTVRLSYLATGFTWSADYVAHLRPDGRTLDLIGWLTLSNASSASFGHAPTDVVAGDLSRDEDTLPPEVQPVSLEKACWGGRSMAYDETPPAPAPPLMAMRMAAPADGVQEMVVTAERRLAKQGDLGDYKLYTLPEPTTVAARQTKQVMFLDQKGVRYERIYTYRQPAGRAPSRDIEIAPTVVLRLRNEAAQGLGKPLPSGTISVMEEAPGGGPALAGEQRVRDTAVGLPLELELGRAMDIAVTPQIVHITASDGTVRDELAVGVVNAKPVAVVVEFRQTVAGRDFQVRSETQPHTTKAGEPLWTLTVAPGARANLRYVVSYRLN